MSFSKDIIIYLAQFLELIAITRLAGLNKEWYQFIMNNNQIWRRFCTDITVIDEMTGSRKYYPNDANTNYRQLYKDYQTSIIKTIHYDNKTMILLKNNYLQVDDQMIHIDSYMIMNNIIDVDEYIFIIAKEKITLWNKLLDFNHKNLFNSYHYFTMINANVMKIVKIDMTYMTLADNGFVDCFELSLYGGALQLNTTKNVAEIFIMDGAFYITKNIGGCLRTTLFPVN